MEVKESRGQLRRDRFGKRGTTKNEQRVLLLTGLC